MREITMQMTADFILETMEPRSSWKEYFYAVKETVNIEFQIQQKYPLGMS